MMASPKMFFLLFLICINVLPCTAFMFSKREVIKIIQRLAEEDKLPKPKNGPGTGTGFRRGTKVKNRFKIDSEIDKRPEYHLHFPEEYWVLAESRIPLEPVLEVFPYTALMFSKKEVLQLLQRIAEENMSPKPMNGPGSGTSFRKGTKKNNRFKASSKIDQRPEYSLNLPKIKD